VGGGNDYPARQAGVACTPVRGPGETKLVIEAIATCLGGERGHLLTVDDGLEAA
jgi:hypothetical protein